MYLCRIRLNPGVGSQQLAEMLCQDSYREHQMLWKLFASDPHAKRDFLYRQVNERGKIKYYVLSERSPIDTTGVWLIDPPKHYAPQLYEGQQLFFVLRANPVITVSRPDGKKQRHDVVMHEKKRIGYGKQVATERPELQQLIQTTCCQWLQKRAGPSGFSITPKQITVDGYRQHQSFAKDRKNPVTYSTVDFQGVLTVSDPEKLKRALFSGIGKAKAFGCGLLLVRRA